MRVRRLEATGPALRARISSLEADFRPVRRVAPDVAGGLTFVSSGCTFDDSGWPTYCRSQAPRPNRLLGSSPRQTGAWD